MFLYSFGPYKLDPSHKILLRDNQYIRIRPQAFELLRILVEHNNKVVCQEELVQQLWGNPSQYGLNNRLYVAISALKREVLAGLDEEGIRLETLSGVGYRLIADVNIIAQRDITEAQRLYIEGRYFWANSNMRSVRKAISRFEQVVALDPTNADAYAALSDSWVLAGSFGHQSVSPREAMPKAEANAAKALALNETLAEAIAALASVRALYRWDWQSARPLFQQAMNLSYNPYIRIWYALCLAGRGEEKESIFEIEKVLQYNPDKFLLKAILGRLLYLSGDIDKAVAACQEAIDFEEHFYLGYVFLGHALRVQGRLTDALQAFHKAQLFGYEHPVILADIGNTYGLLGESATATQYLETLKHKSQEMYISPYVFAMIHLGLGDINQTLYYLKEAYNEREAYLIFLTTEPIYKPLVDEPQFKQLIKDVGFAAS